MSQKTRLKMSLAHTGVKFSEERRANMSKAQSGQNNGMYGKKHSELAKRKMGLSAKRNWANPEIRTHYMDSMRTRPKKKK